MKVDKWLSYFHFREIIRMLRNVQCLSNHNITFKMLKVKVKCTLVQALRLCTGRTAHRGSRGIALLFHDHGTRRGRGVSVTPPPLFTPRKRPSIHSTGGWMGPQGRSGEVGKISLPPGFDPRTVHLVASRYTDWATRPTITFKLATGPTITFELSIKLSSHSWQ
jgi:hypothetical protein